MPPDKIIKAVGTVTLEAAAADADGNESGNKKITITGYTGGLMNVGWGALVGIDLAGLKWDDSQTVPVLALHDSHDLDAICGQTSRIRVEGSNLILEGELMPVSDAAKKIAALAKAGYKFQASVGVSASDTLYLEADQTYDLNGAEVTGECYIVRAGTLREISIVPLGADGRTETAIAAALNQGKEGTMPKEKDKVVEAAKPVDTTAEVKAAQVAERERTAGIVKACHGHDDIMAKAIEEGWTAEKAELECLRAEKQKAAKDAIEAGRPSAPSITDVKAAVPRTDKVLTAAACLGAAMDEKAVVARFGAETAEQAHDLGVHRISDVFAAAGFDYRPGDLSGMEKAVRAAFSNANIGNIIGNTVRAFVMKGFGKIEDVYQRVIEPISVADFKAVKGVRLVMGGTLQPLSKGGELKHVSLSDEATSIQAATKGSIVGITREDLINDDLGVLAAVPTKFGEMAARTLARDVFAVITANHANFGKSTTGALTAASLAAADAEVATIQDAEGNPLGLTVNKLLCGPANKTAANEIYKSQYFIGGNAKAPQSNVMAGMYEPIVSAFLTGSAYYLFSEEAPLVRVAFLNGVQAPTIETANVDFDQLGIRVRCYFDYGTAPGELATALYSTGA